jgi:hypothetical protein
MSSGPSEEQSGEGRNSWLSKGHAAPSFSLILTFYNQEEFVRTAVESALSQRADPIVGASVLEVIAVDDGSNDNTLGVLRSFGDAIRTVWHDTNRGPCAARNSGAEIAKGDYLAFLDGDDAFTPWAMALYRTLASFKRPKIMLGSMSWFAGSLPPVTEAPHEIRFVEHTDYFSKDRAFAVSASALVIERESFHEVGGWEGLLPAEDCDLLCRLGVDRRLLQVIEPPASFHRSHDRQTIRQTSRMMLGVQNLVERERSGAYPGGRSRAYERRACLGGLVFHMAKVTARRSGYTRGATFALANWTLILTAVFRRIEVRLRGRRPIQVITEWPTADLSSPG